jgi:hypothetical protein
MLNGPRKKLDGGIGLQKRWTATDESESVPHCYCAERAYVASPPVARAPVRASVDRWSHRDLRSQCIRCTHATRPLCFLVNTRYRKCIWCTHSMYLTLIADQNKCAWIFIWISPCTPRQLTVVLSSTILIHGCHQRLSGDRWRRRL